jgi:hypothetical protein
LLLHWLLEPLHRAVQADGDVKLSTHPLLAPRLHETIHPFPYNFSRRGSRQDDFLVLVYWFLLVMLMGLISLKRLRFDLISQRMCIEI